MYSNCNPDFWSPRQETSSFQSSLPDIFARPERPHTMSASGSPNGDDDGDDDTRAEAAAHAALALAQLRSQLKEPLR